MVKPAIFEKTITIGDIIRTKNLKLRLYSSKYSSGDCSAILVGKNLPKKIIMNTTKITVPATAIIAALSEKFISRRIVVAIGKMQTPAPVPARMLKICVTAIGRAVASKSFNADSAFLFPSFASFSILP